MLLERLFAHVGEERRNMLLDEILNPTFDEARVKTRLDVNGNTWEQRNDGGELSAQMQITEALGCAAEGVYEDAKLCIASAYTERLFCVRKG